MRNFKTLSQEEKEKIKEEKRKNPFISISSLSKKYSLYESTLNTFFRKNHLTTRELTGLRYRRYEVNDNYFDKIDSHEKAYLLGVLYSDGYLVIEGDNTKRIGLDVKDTDWLEEIGKTLGSNAPLYKTAKEEIKRLKLTSPKMFEDLKKLGCVEHKTFLLKFPTKEQVPEEFLNSFILGVLDGDGSITLTHPKRMKTFSIQISFTGTKELLQGIQKFLKVEHLTLRQRFPERNNNNYTLTISGFQQCYQILSSLYENAPKCILKRKYDKFCQIKNDSRATSKNCSVTSG